MRFLVSFLLPGLLCGGALPYFSVSGDDPGGWPRVLSSIGLQPQSSGGAAVFVLRSGATGSAEWPARVENGAFLILEGQSAVAEMFGFHAGKENARIGSLEDVHRPGLSIIWEKALELPSFTLPQDARVFARDRWSGVPVLAGIRRGSGAVLWTITSPGERGYERFPYLLHALEDLGFEPPFRSSRLWAFFDHSYRLRVDLDYFAARWREAGIAALHVAAWHFFEPDPERDAYLHRLIEACHREGILVYAWLELPHVSEKFWADHPEWREKTAVLQDAQLDWRKLMNLQNPACFRAAATGVQHLIHRFDWDGINLAELYFESLEGAANPSRFTPMNDDVRTAFRAARGFDPVEIFRRPDPERLRQFLQFRAGLTRQMQQQWLNELEQTRRKRPDCDLVLTHVDDRLDQGMRDAIGADSAQVLPLLGSRQVTFLVEDPATVWNQGPDRYAELARRYQDGVVQRERPAIDINIVERYQDVYPTRQQTGTELFQLVHIASGAFSRVALYAENSLLAPDARLLSAAGAVVKRVERIGPKQVVDSGTGVGVPWTVPPMVDGAAWPIWDGATVWLPPGPHAIENDPAPGRRPLVRRFTGSLESAQVLGKDTVEISYSSQARAIAVLGGIPARVEIDGVSVPPSLAGPATLLLPRGQHLVTVQIK